jgi:ribosome-interacting GTPase 1
LWYLGLEIVFVDNGFHDQTTQHVHISRHTFVVRCLRLHGMWLGQVVGIPNVGKSTLINALRRTARLGTSTQVRPPYMTPSKKVLAGLFRESGAVYPT